MCMQFVTIKFLTINIYRKNLLVDSDRSFRGSISEARLRGPRRDRRGKKGRGEHNKIYYA